MLFISFTIQIYDFIFYRKRYFLSPPSLRLLHSGFSLFHFPIPPFLSPLYPPLAFTLHRMNRTAPTSILWHENAPNGQILGHRMNATALSHILCLLTAQAIFNPPPPVEGYGGPRPTLREFARRVPRFCPYPAGDRVFSRRLCRFSAEPAGETGGRAEKGGDGNGQRSGREGEDVRG